MIIAVAKPHLYQKSVYYESDYWNQRPLINNTEGTDRFSADTDYKSKLEYADKSKKR